MKKIVIPIIIILIIILLVLYAYFYFSNESNKLSKDEFLSLMRSFYSVSNVKVDGPRKTYKKDEYILEIDEDGEYTWANLNTKVCIKYDNERKTYTNTAFRYASYEGFEIAKFKFIRI